MKFIGTWLANAVAIGVAAWLVPGIMVVGGGWEAPIVTALFLSIVNVLVKPIARILSLPVTVATLGLFLLVINALMLELASYLALNVTHVGLALESFGSTFVAALVVSVVSGLVGGVVVDD